MFAVVRVLMMFRVIAPVADTATADPDVLTLIAPAIAIALMTLSDIPETWMSPSDVMLTPATSARPISAVVSKSISFFE